MNDTVTRNDLVKNGKFFVAPQQNDKPFKELFAELMAQGAGSPVDDDGFPAGPWTPETLTDAICALRGNEEGIELRTVQRWFQDNDKGILPKNVGLLARIFGCDDGTEAGNWRVALNKSITLQKKIRLANKDAVADRSKTDNQVSAFKASEKRHPFSARMALRINAMLTGGTYIFVIIMIWGLWSILGMSAIILGLAEVSYTTDSGTEKQVGLYQAPAWTIEKLILIPVYFLITSRAVSAWIDSRHQFVRSPKSETWEDRVASFAPAFFLVILVCVIVVFALQWYGTYYLPLLAGPDSGIEPNWIRVATNPITIIPTSIIIPLSFYGGMFIGFVYWVCFSGLLLLYIAARDITILNANLSDPTDTQPISATVTAARDLVTAFYRCIICGALINIAIKVDAIYFISDTESLFKFLKLDLLSALGVDGNAWTYLAGREFPSFVSAIFLLIITSFAYVGIYQIKLFTEGALRHQVVTHAQVITVPAFLMFTYAMLGEFTGFTLLLIASVVVGVMQLARPATSIAPLAPDRK
ncbi:membrane protein [Tateyamaria omphalii]|nr:membrane protein [Tateyamaria omphalii]